MMKKNIIIIGATSCIAQEIAKLFAHKGHRLFLVGRDSQHLQAIANDLHIRGCDEIHYETYDLTKCEDHSRIMDSALRRLGHIDTILIAHGHLPDQKLCEKDFTQTYAELKINFLSVISILTLFANYFEQQRKGSIAVISSVAGDRGRQSNYIYGTAKAGLNTFLQGLRNRLSRANVNVITIKPGFIDTPMTKNFKKGILWAKPETVAKQIVKAINQNKQEVYVPYFWRYIMFLIKRIPEKLFCKLML